METARHDSIDFFLGATTPAGFKGYFEPLRHEPGMQMYLIKSGPGCGKSTLLNILAALDRPTAGEVLLSGRNLETIPEGDLAAFRRDNLGFVFQEFNLLDTFSIEDNIFLPLVLAGMKYEQMQERLAPIAAQLGMNRPVFLSRTTHTKQLVVLEMRCSRHRVGILIPLARATSRMV